MLDWKLSPDANASCIGKEAFDTPQAAAKARKHIARRWNAKRRDNLESYRCSHCGRWHLGRPPRQSIQELNRLHDRALGHRKRPRDSRVDSAKNG